MHARQTELLKGTLALTHSLTPEALGLSRSKVTAVMDMKSREANDILLRMASSENLYEKRMLIVMIDRLVREISNDDGVKTALLAWVIFRSGLYTILPQLHLAKIFFSVAPSVLPLCYDAVELLLSKAPKIDPEQMESGSTKEDLGSGSE
jgi:hypothetical protein